MVYNFMQSTEILIEHPQRNSLIAMIVILIHNIFTVTHIELHKKRSFIFVALSYSFLSPFPAL